jgi:hypothetical protein
VALLGLPELVTHRSRLASVMPAALAISALLVTLSALYAVVVWLLPIPVLDAVLGSTAPSFVAVLLPSAVAVVMACLSWGPMIALRALGAARASLTARVLIGTLSFALPLAGSLVAGVQGFFWSTAVSFVLQGVCAVAVLRWAESRARNRAAPRPVSAHTERAP